MLFILQTKNWAKEVKLFVKKKKKKKKKKRNSKNCNSTLDLPYSFSVQLMRENIMVLALLCLQ
jgi:hypothetical protein